MKTMTQLLDTSLGLPEINCTHAQFILRQKIPNMGFSDGSVVKKPPAMQEMWVPSLGRKDPLETEVASQSRILAWEIPWTEESGGL